MNDPNEDGKRQVPDDHYSNPGSPTKRRHSHSGERNPNDGRCSSPTVSSSSSMNTTAAADNGMPYGNVPPPRPPSRAGAYNSVMTDRETLMGMVIPNPYPPQQAPSWFQAANLPTSVLPQLAANVFPYIFCNPFSITNTNQPAWNVGSEAGGLNQMRYPAEEYDTDDTDEDIVLYSTIARKNPNEKGKGK